MSERCLQLVNQTTKLLLADRGNLKGKFKSSIREQLEVLYLSLKGCRRRGWRRFFKVLEISKEISKFTKRVKDSLQGVTR
jgi:hypothetical protein